MAPRPRPPAQPRTLRCSPVAMTTDGARRRGNWVERDDPDFTIKVRVIYQIIKSMHHLGNVAGKEAPPIIRRIAVNLAGFIKPASPNSATMTLLLGNARNWEHNTLIILQEHDEKCMNSDLQKMAVFYNKDWRGTLLVATWWAHKNVGRRLKPDTLLEVVAFLTANLTPIHHTTATNTPRNCSPVPVPAPGPASVGSTSAQAVMHADAAVTVETAHGPSPRPTPVEKRSVATLRTTMERSWRTARLVLRSGSETQTQPRDQVTSAARPIAAPQVSSTPRHNPCVTLDGDEVTVE